MAFEDIAFAITVLVERLALVKQRFVQGRPLESLRKVDIMRELSTFSYVVQHSGPRRVDMVNKSLGRDERRRRRLDRRVSTTNFIVIVYPGLFKVASDYSTVHPTASSNLSVMKKGMVTYSNATV